MCANDPDCDDNNPCTVDTCDQGSFTCMHVAGNAGTTCHPATGPCEDDSQCDGSSTSCPSNFKSTNFVCQQGSDLCEDDATCTGSSAACPPNPFKDNSTTCRSASDDCDLPAKCTGSSAACPANPFKDSSTQCRSASDDCDLPATCTGNSAACPANPFKNAGTGCPSDGNPCTQNVCSGNSAACTHPPGNAGTQCRSAADVCDLPATCNGASAVCPPNPFKDNTNQCRGAADECDLPAKCSGSSAACPANPFRNSGTGCTPDSNPCTADICNGSSAACTHPAGNPGAQCRAATGECDSPATCTGLNSSCPANPFRNPGTSCTADSNPCTQDICNGSSASCTHPAGNAGAFCRAATGECDLPATCTGGSTSCPGNPFKNPNTACTPDSNPCTADICDGTTAVCTHPAGNAGAVCRSATGECDLPGTCTGGSTSCPANPFAAPGSPCTPDSNVCTNDVCNGASAACTHPNNTAPCDDSIFCNGADTCHNGACAHAGDPCVGGPECNQTCNEAVANCFDPTTTVCTPDTNLCTDDLCDGAGACGHPFNTAPCSDNNACTQGDVCQGGTCVPGPSVVCNALDECHLPGACDTVTGLCASPAKPDGADCTADGIFCTDDICLTGVCQHQPSDTHCDHGDCVLGQCRPGDPNARADGCVEVPVGEGQACTDDGFTCTDDVCNSGSCLHVPVDSRCVPPGECTSAVCLPGGQDASTTGCVGGPPRQEGQECAEDGNPCTDDLCHSGMCAHQPVSGTPNCTLTCEPVEQAFRRALSLSGLARGLQADVAQDISPSTTGGLSARGQLIDRLGHAASDLTLAAGTLAGRNSPPSQSACESGGGVAKTPAQIRARIAAAQLGHTRGQIVKFLHLVKSARKRLQLTRDGSRDMRRRGSILLQGTRKLLGELRRLVREHQVFVP
jgi:hypothetical protein